MLMWKLLNAMPNFETNQ